MNQEQTIKLIRQIDRGLLTLEDVKGILLRSLNTDNETVERDVKKGEME